MAAKAAAFVPVGALLSAWEHRDIDDMPTSICILSIVGSVTRYMAINGMFSVFVSEGDGVIGLHATCL